MCGKSFLLQHYPSNLPFGSYCIRFHSFSATLETLKSLRDGKANLVDSYAIIDNEEAWLLHFHIDAYTPATQFNHHPMRKRKLLLHKKEISKLIGKTQEKGCTLVPLKVYFKNGKAKVDLGICKAKKLYDKRAALKKREADREIDRGMKSRNR